MAKCDLPKRPRYRSAEPRFDGFSVYILHNPHYDPLHCTRKVRMSHICKVEVSHFPVLAGLECGGGIGCYERTRAEPH